MGSKTKKLVEDFEGNLDIALRTAEEHGRACVVVFNIISGRHGRYVSDTLPPAFDRADWRKRATAYPDGTVVFHNMD